MNRKTFTFKIITIFMCLVFMAIPLAEINSHTYSIGVSNFNMSSGCFGSYAVPFDYIEMGLSN